MSLHLKNHQNFKDVNEQRAFSNSQHKPKASRILQQLDNWLEIQGTTGKGTFYTLKGSQKDMVKNKIFQIIVHSCLI